MKWKLPRLSGQNEEPENKEPEIPQLREGFNTYVLHGDLLWGDAITWTASPSETGDEHRGRIHGWVLPRPENGDRLLVKMQSGQWGWWVIHNVERPSTVHDMFFADAIGAFGYVEKSEEPKSKRASEFVQTGDLIL